MLTIGHSTLSSGTFLKILKENGVACVADIRTIPKSRHNPQFAREALPQALAAEGIGYRWLPALGGLRKPRRDLDGLNAGWRNASFRGFADYMQSAEFSAAVDGLLEMEAGLLAANPASGAVLMCAEAVPWRCHRSLIADALLARGRRAEHVFFDSKGASKRQPHRMTPFARSEGARVWYPAPALELDFGVQERAG